MIRRDFLIAACSTLTALDLGARKSRAAQPAPDYPPPDAAPGAPFDNPNLKLVVLETLRKRGLIDLGTPQQLARHVYGRDVALWREGRDLSRPLYDYLVRYPLSREQVAAVDALYFDGGLEIYRYAFYQWDGEGDEFDVHSLMGVEMCANLRRYDEVSMVVHADLRYLSGLRRLEYVGLSDVVHVSAWALRDLPNLAELDVYRTSLDDASVLDALRADGVRVRRLR